MIINIIRLTSLEGISLTSFQFNLPRGLNFFSFSVTSVGNVTFTTQAKRCPLPVPIFTFDVREAAAFVGVLQGDYTNFDNPGIVAQYDPFRMKVFAYPSNTEYSVSLTFSSVVDLDQGSLFPPRIR